MKGLNIQWPVLACLSECGHFRSFPTDEVPVLGARVRCLECAVPDYLDDSSDEMLRAVLATVSVADLVRLFDAEATAGGASDPRKTGGGISGPGGAFEVDSVVIDTRNAVLLEGCEVAVVGGVRDGVLDEKPATALVLRGRINQTPERVQNLYLLNEDGAAGIVTELVDVAARAGWGREFVERVVARLAAMPEGPRA